MSSPLCDSSVIRFKFICVLLFTSVACPPTPGLCLFTCAARNINIADLLEHFRCLPMHEFEFALLRPRRNRHPTACRTGGQVRAEGGIGPRNARTMALVRRAAQVATGNTSLLMDAIGTLHRKGISTPFFSLKFADHPYDRTLSVLSFGRGPLLLPIALYETTKPAVTRSRLVPKPSTQVVNKTVQVNVTDPNCTLGANDTNASCSDIVVNKTVNETVNITVNVTEYYNVSYLVCRSLTHPWHEWCVLTWATGVVRCPLIWSRVH